MTMKCICPVLLATAVLAAVPPFADPHSDDVRGNQSAAEDSYKSKKTFATALFNQQHHLEALPLFEELARENPKDSDVLFSWGACLIDHSATLADEAAGRRERIKARELLIRAKQLGNNSTLLLNLLDMIPPDGSIRHDADPNVDQAIQAGEAAFARNNYQEAIQEYSKAFELDPRNYSAALFIGDSYFALKNFAKAEEWYNRAIQVSPDVETAYRYEADMFTKNGDMEEARKLVIQAIVAEPYNQIPWRALMQWANANHVKIAPPRIKAQSEVTSNIGESTSVVLDGKALQGSGAVWLVYRGVRLNWRQGEFRKHYPQENQYRHTLTEETEALGAAARVLTNQKPSAVAADPDLTLLKTLADAKMLEPYVLLSAADNDITLDYAAYRKEHRDRLEDYLNRFVVPAALSKP